MKRSFLFAVRVFVGVVCLAIPPAAAVQRNITVPDADGNNYALYFTGVDHTTNLIGVVDTVPIGSWEQVSLVYTATAADTGKKIGIEMQSAGYLTFEDVTLIRSSGSITVDPRPNLHKDTIINFKDCAVLGDKFLDEDMFP